MKDQVRGMIKEYMPLDMSQQNNNGTALEQDDDDDDAQGTFT
jgi:hypothetical protein